MIVKIKVGDLLFSCNLNTGHDISIPFKNDSGVIAFGADAYSSKPYKAGDFIGALENGSPVNFYNIYINPHGNGTHTESVRHIDNRGLSIYETLKTSHFVSKLVTLKPETLNDGDRIINSEHFERLGDIKNVEALIIRTMPNSKKKLEKNYTGTNPCYVDFEFIQRLNNSEVKHLLIDMPSVDREIDGGKLSAHKAYWQIDKDIAMDKTITEMIYVDNDIQDGLYLLNLQTISVDIDASPSKPIIYALKEI